MAKTYYKYAERNVDSQINWAEVGKNITDMLGEEAKVREEKKAALDESTRKYGEILSNSPMGEHSGLNKKSLDLAADAQQLRLIQDRLLRSGQLNLRDYTIMRQNMQDGTKGAFDVLKEFQSEYKDKMERAASQDPNTRSQYLEQWYMANVETFFGDDSKFYFNPTNGSLSVGKQRKNPDTGVYDMSGDYDEVATINELRNRIKSKFNYFNFEDVANKYVDALGDVSRVVKVPGGWKTITDPQARGKIKDPKTKKEADQFATALEAQLESFLGPDGSYNPTSILTNDIGTIDGQTVSFTMDEEKAKANPHLILLRPNPSNPGGPGIPDFSTDNGKKQKEIAKDYMRKQIIVKLDSKESFQQGTPMQQWQYQIGQDKKNMQSLVNNLAYLHSGTNAQVTEAMNYLKGIAGVRGVNRTPNGFSMTFEENGRLITKDVNFKAPDGTPLTAEQFVRSASSLVMGGQNVDPQAVANASLSVKGQPFNSAFTFQTQATVDAGADPSKAYGQAIDARTQTIMPTGASEEEVRDNINSAFGGIGVSARVPYTYGNFIEITAPNGAVSPEINLDLPNAKQDIANFIKANPKGEDAKEQMINMLNAVKSGTLGGSATTGSASGDAIFQ